MFVRFAIFLAIFAYILPFGKAYGGVVTLGDTGHTGVINALTTSLWIRFTTVANGAASFNLTSIRLRGTASDSVTYKLYNSAGNSIINSISGTRTMTNGLLDLTGENSFGSGGTLATYVLQIDGLLSNTYLRSNAGTSTQSGADLFLPSSDTGILTNAYEQIDLTHSTRVGGGSSYAVVLSIAVPEPSTFFLMGSVLLTAIVFTCANSFRKCQTKKRMG